MFISFKIAKLVVLIVASSTTSLTRLWLSLKRGFVDRLSEEL
jgi:hypothetical protein